MAVAFVGSSNLIATNGGAPGAITPHASSVAGNLLVFYHYSRATGGNETVTVPTGFTEAFNSVTANNGLVAVGYRIMQAGDTTFTASITNHTSGTTGETVLEWIGTFSGTDVTTPISSFTSSLSTWASSTTLGPISAPTGNVPVGGMLVAFAGRFDNITGQTTLTGDGLTWAQGTLNDTNSGSDAAAVTQFGLNETASAVTPTAKSITTTGTAQAGAGRMFVIQPPTNVDATVSATTVSSTVETAGSSVVAEDTSAIVVQPSTVECRVGFGLSIGTETTAGGGPVALRSTTHAASDTLTSSFNVTVPSGAQIGDIALIFIELWESASATITWPSGFTQIGTITVNGSQKLASAWKRLTAADSGNYAVSNSATHWTQWHCYMISGAVASGSPIEAFDHRTTTPASASLTTATQPFLIHVSAKEGAGPTYTPPTNYTELADTGYIASSYYIPGSTGTFTASGVAETGTPAAFGFYAIAGAGGGAGETITGAVVTPFTVTSTVTISGTAQVSEGTPANISATSIDVLVEIPSGTVDAQVSATISAVTVTRTVTIGTTIVTDTFFPFVTAASANGRYVVDQNGNPVTNLFDTIWPFVQQAGRDNSGDWQGDMDLWVETRASQGFTGIKWTLLAQVINGAPADLLTHDDVSPFNTSSPSTADISQLNNTYWTRVDYLIDKAAAHGLTCWVHVMYKDDVDTGAWLDNKSQAQLDGFGTALGNRYKNKPNIVWVYGGDYYDDEWQNMERIHDAIAATGDTHLVTVQNHSDSSNATYYTTSRRHSNTSVMSLGSAIATIEGLYVYGNLPAAAQQGWNTTPALPLSYYDGYYWQGTLTDLRLRRDMGWSITSGVYTHHLGDEGNWSMSSGWRTRLDAVPVLTTGLAILESLTGWENLVPDWNSTFITAGRGTGTSYVTGAKTPDNSLAFIYMPNAASSITVDTAQLPSNYTVTWVDPYNGNEVAGSQGTSFSRGTNNSAGAADWLLVLESQPQPATVSATTVSGAVALDSPTTAAGTGQDVSPATIALAATIDVSVPAAGTGASVVGSVVAATVEIPAPTVLSGSASDATPLTITSTVVIAGETTTADAVVVASTIASSVVVAGETVTAGQQAAVTGTVVSSTVEIPAPTVTAASPAGATPSTIASTVVIGGTVAAGQQAVVTVTTVSSTVAIDAPTVVAPVSAEALATTVARTVTIGAPTLVAGSGSGPTSVTVSSQIVIPGPAVSAGGPPPVVGTFVGWGMPI